MKHLIIGFLAMIFTPAIYLTGQNKAELLFVNKKMGEIELQYSNMIRILNDSVKPPRTYKNGRIFCVNTDDWTSGFFSGSLWYLYEYTKDPQWLKDASKWTSILEKEKYNTHTHDLGFMLYCSYGNGL
jgi:unsaturated chondroitin disaccharide hydrolase